jgi:hypothetical protein
MQEILDIYGEALTKFVSLRSRLMTELQEIQFILDNELCDAHGEPLDSESCIEVINNLNADKTEVQNDLSIVNIEIKHIRECLNAHLIA